MGPDLEGDVRGEARPWLCLLTRHVLSRGLRCRGPSSGEDADSSQLQAIPLQLASQTQWGFGVCRALFLF